MRRIGMIVCSVCVWAGGVGVSHVGCCCWVSFCARMKFCSIGRCSGNRGGGVTGVFGCCGFSVVRCRFGFGLV